MKTSYLELSKFSKEKKKSFLNEYNSMFVKNELIPFILDKPFDKFNDYGLKYSSEQLNLIGVSAAIFPIEIMENYVDETTKILVDENAPELHSCFCVDTVYLIENLNATSFGNLAYIINNSKDENLVTETKRILNYLYLEVLEIMTDLQKNIAQA